MPTRTPNHGYRLFAQGEMPWDHREEFQQLDIEAPIVRPDTEKSTFEPKANALFVAYEGPVYRGDGASWIQIGDLSGGGGGGGDPTLTEGIDSTRQHVGALHHGSYNSSSRTNGGYGIVFSAPGLYIDSVVVDSDLSGVTKTTLPIELRQYQGGAQDPTIVASTTATLTGGAERISLGFTVPAAGAADADPNNEYVLQRGAVPTGEEVIPLRRRWDNEGDWSVSEYSDQTYTDPTIDFIKGTNTGETGDYGAEGSWYFFFDWLVGDTADRVMSPRSTDVEEIYMRPRPPEEEFDNVSPRSIWFDTSGA